MMGMAEWRIALFIYDGAWASSVLSSLDFFQSVNLRAKRELFHCDIVTPTPEAAKLYSGREQLGDTHIGQDCSYDLIMLSHYWGDFERAIQQYPDVPGWLARQYHGGAIIAGINSGIFWAAEAGLLQGRQATTYWRHRLELQHRYPETQWQENQALTQDAGIYSSNGQNSSVDLSIHLVEKFCGAEMAAGLARDITFDNRRNYNLTLFNIAGLRQHLDDGIHKAQDWLDQHYPEKIELHVLADLIGMSKRTFIRRFQKATGEKPSRYLQRLRVEAAKHRLVNSEESIKTIGLNVGYRDIPYFSQVFKSMTELTPLQYRKRLRPRNTSPKNSSAGD